MDAAKRGIEFMKHEMFLRRECIREGDRTIAPIVHEVWEAVMMIIKGTLPSKFMRAKFSEKLKIYGLPDDLIEDVMTAISFIERYYDRKINDGRRESLLINLGIKPPRGAILDNLIKLMQSDDIFIKAFIDTYLRTKELQTVVYHYLKLGDDSWAKDKWAAGIPPELLSTLDELAHYPELRGTVIRLIGRQL